MWPSSKEPSLEWNKGVILIMQYTIVNRKRNIEEMLELIREATLAVKDKFVAEYCLVKGLSEKTVNDYLRILTLSGKIYEKDGVLKINETELKNDL